MQYIFSRSERILEVRILIPSKIFCFVIEHQSYLVTFQNISYFGFVLFLISTIGLYHLRVAFCS